MVEIINPYEKGDNHCHTLNFSDGFCTIDEMVKYAISLNYDELTITDHADSHERKHSYQRLSIRGMIARWQNCFNDKLKVRFGVEADILNEDGDICDVIQGKKSDFIILSAHFGVYQSDASTINEGYLNALERYGDKIAFIGHPCAKYFEKHVDIDGLVEAANQRGIPLEVNGANLINKKTNLKHLELMLKLAHRSYVNSDGHTAYEFMLGREMAFEAIRQLGFKERKSGIYTK